MNRPFRCIRHQDRLHTLNPTLLLNIKSSNYWGSGNTINQSELSGVIAWGLCCASGHTAPCMLLALHFHERYTNVGANFVVISRNDWNQLDWSCKILEVFFWKRMKQLLQFVHVHVYTDMCASHGVNLKLHVSYYKVTLWDLFLISSHMTFLPAHWNP